MRAAPWFTRSVRLAGVALLAGAGLLLAPEALAAGGPSRAALAPASAGDASGQVVLKSRPRGDRVRLRLRNLEPRTAYEVRDGITGSTLAGFSSNRHGRGKVSFTSDLLADGVSVGLAGLPIRVCLAESGEPVLEGAVPGEDREDGPCWYDLTYEVGTVESAPDADVRVSIVMSSVSGPDLQIPMDSISLFVAPNRVYAMAEDGGASGAIPGPVTFWIADGEGTLQEVASVEEAGYGDPAGGPGRDGKGMMLTAECGPAGFTEPGSDCVEFLPPSFYSWYADNSTAEGLPLGVDAVADLSGRSFEVRDGEGTVLLSGELPALEKIVFDPPPPSDITVREGIVQSAPDAAVQVAIYMSSVTSPDVEGSMDSMFLSVSPAMVWAWESGMDMPEWTAIPGPVSLLIADADGVLQEVAVLEAANVWGDPATGVRLLADGSMPSFPDLTVYFWSADNSTEGGLPFGVGSVADLSGRSFEVRDGEGTVLLSGDLPALEEVKYEPVPLPGPGTWTGSGGMAGR